MRSIEKQRDAARRQAAMHQGTFFTTPWGPWTQTPMKAEPRGSGSCDALPPDRLDPLVLEASQVTGVSANLIRAVIWKESGGRPCAVSPKGAQGLMQLMPALQADLAISNAFDPAINILGGSRYLKNMLGKYDGKINLALAAYNAGPGKVTDAVPDIDETRQYVEEVIGKYDELEGAAKAQPPQD